MSEAIFPVWSSHRLILIRNLGILPLDESGALQEIWLFRDVDPPHVDGFHCVCWCMPDAIRRCGCVDFLIRVGVPFCVLGCGKDHFQVALLELCEIEVQSLVVPFCSPMSIAIRNLAQLCGIHPQCAKKSEDI